MTLEEFRAEVLEVNMTKAGLPTRLLRTPTWADGTPKGWSALSMESVPEADRARTIAEMHQALLQG